MCTSPYIIKNFNRGGIPKYLGKRLYKSFEFGLNNLSDCTGEYIKVPCGRCPSCVAIKQGYKVQRVQMESLNNHLFMFTLTYKNTEMPTTDVNGVRIRYADIRDISNMFKRIRVYDRLGTPFRYMVVSEFGGKYHRPHFHGIITIPKNGETYNDLMNMERNYFNIFRDEWRRNYGCRRVPDYHQLCDYISNWKGRTFDFHYVNPSATDAGEQDVAFYVTKYVHKIDPYVDRLKSALALNTTAEEFADLWKLVKPRCLMSKGFGDPHNPKVQTYVENCIKNSLKDENALYPTFSNPISGFRTPLCPYYRERWLTLEQARVFWTRSRKLDKLDLGVDAVDAFIYTEDYDPRDIFRKDEEYDKRRVQMAVYHREDEFEKVSTYTDIDVLTELRNSYEENSIELSLLGQEQLEADCFDTGCDDWDDLPL